MSVRAWCRHDWAYRLAMHVCAVSVELHIPQATSLKAKRSVLLSLIETVRKRFPVAIAEVGHQDTWQRTEIGISAVSGSARQVEEILNDVECYIWSIPEAEVLEITRTWLEPN